MSLLAPSALFFVTLLGAGTPSLATIAQQTGFVRTGRHDEVVRLCQAFAAAYPAKVRCAEFGRTPEGRPLLALLVSGDGVLTPAATREKERPVVLFQGGIHAGEIDGKDAGFLLLQEMLAGRRLPGVLDRLTAVFVPVFNVDGHERFGKNNRPNQNGPLEMGWRVTAQNLNLNRDYVKAEAPEMVAMLRLLQEWDPLLYIDLHVTDGADFQPDVAIQIEPQLGGPQRLRAIGAVMKQGLFRDLSAQGHLPLPFYPSFNSEGDPTSGFGMGIAPPRFSHGYWPLKNRFGVLVETHSWKDYRTRVRATTDAVAGLLAQVAAHGAEWLLAAHAADEDDRKLPGATVALAYDHTERQVPLKFPGYAYRIEPSAISGALRITYDRRRPEVWEVPFHDEVKPVLSAAAPGWGYVVPPAQALWLGEKLRLHGLTFSTLPQDQKRSVQTFRVSEKKFRGESYEGRLLVQVKGNWTREVRTLKAGALLVPVGQRGGQLLVQMLEPQASDSFMSWGFFNSSLEQKEYMESYVAEQQAVAMLARDPALRREFLQKLKSEPEFARDPAARLRFFHQHHPSWDEHYNLYPVFRLDQAP